MSPRRALLALCVLALLGAAAATESQLQAGACSFDGHDFSSLMGQDFKGSDGGSQYEYFMAICGPLSTSATSTCTQIDPASSVCQIQVQGGAQSFDIGNWPASSPPAWSYIDADKSGVQYKLTGAPQCWAQGGQPQPYTGTVVLKCAGTAGALTVTSPPQSCDKTYTLPTPLACKGGGSSHKKGGLSGGWVFIIILCVVFPVYVVGGCVYKSQKLGATGMDKCPNVEFWRDLPSLVKDGIRFFVAKVRGLCGGGGSSGGNTYETM